VLRSWQCACFLKIFREIEFDRKHETFAFSFLLWYPSGKLNIRV